MSERGSVDGAVESTEAEQKEEEQKKEEEKEAEEEEEDLGALGAVAWRESALLVAAGADRSALSAERAELTARLDSMLSSTSALLLLRQHARSSDSALLASNLALQLRAVFAQLDRIAAHLKDVDAAVSAMESAVAEQTRQKTLSSIKNTFSPISRLFGVEASASQAPFVRPPQSRFDPL